MFDIVKPQLCTIQRIVQETGCQKEFADERFIFLVFSLVFFVFFLLNSHITQKRPQPQKERLKKLIYRIIIFPSQILQLT